MLKTPKQIIEDNGPELQGATAQEIGYLRKFGFVRGLIAKRQSFIEESDVIDFYNLNKKHIKIKK
jgi:hypothetical protein